MRASDSAGMPAAMWVQVCTEQGSECLAWGKREQKS